VSDFQNWNQNEKFFFFFNLKKKKNNNNQTWNPIPNPIYLCVEPEAVEPEAPQPRYL
jgi:hypothetical protein